MMKKIELVLLGEKIRELRKEKGFSQENFANEIGLARSFYGCVERGEKNVTVSNLMKIARALNVKVADLFVSVDQKDKI